MIPESLRDEKVFEAIANLRMLEPERYFSASFIARSIPKLPKYGYIRDADVTAVLRHWEKSGIVSSRPGQNRYRVPTTEYRLELTIPDIPPAQVVAPQVNF